MLQSAALEGQLGQRVYRAGCRHQLRCGRQQRPLWLSERPRAGQLARVGFTSPEELLDLETGFGLRGPEPILFGPAHQLRQDRDGLVASDDLAAMLVCSLRMSGRDTRSARWSPSDSTMYRLTRNWYFLNEPLQRVSCSTRKRPAASARSQSLTRGSRLRTYATRPGRCEKRVVSRDAFEGGHRRICGIDKCWRLCSCSAISILGVRRNQTTQAKKAAQCR